MSVIRLALGMSGFAAAVLGSTVLAAASGTAPQAAPASTPPPPGPGLDLINERCGFCHTTQQVFSTRKTPKDWALVVQSMIDRGAELTPEEQKTVDAYLAANYALPAGAQAAASGGR